MKLKNLSLEDLEMMSLQDIAYAVLKENKKSANTAVLLKEICKLLDCEESFEEKIGDFYTTLNNDKRFVLLDNNEWDIRDNHSVTIVMDDEEDEEEIEEEDEEEIEEEVEDELDNIDDDLDDDLDDDDDDLSDLSIVEDEEDEDLEQ